MCVRSCPAYISSQIKTGILCRGFRLWGISHGVPSRDRTCNEPFGGAYYIHLTMRTNSNHSSTSAALFSRCKLGFASGRRSHDTRSKESDFNGWYKSEWLFRFMPCFFLFAPGVFWAHSSISYSLYIVPNVLTSPLFTRYNAVYH